jgi:hypothetical protein
MGEFDWPKVGEFEVAIGAEALAKLYVQLDGSNSVFVGIHELPPGSPSF